MFYHPRCEEMYTRNPCDLSSVARGSAWSPEVARTPATVSSDTRSVGWELKVTDCRGNLVGGVTEPEAKDGMLGALVIDSLDTVVAGIFGKRVGNGIYAACRPASSLMASETMPGRVGAPVAVPAAAGVPGVTGVPGVRRGAVLTGCPLSANVQVQVRIQAAGNSCR